MLVLQPFHQPDLGLMMFKPGKTLLDELIRMSQGNRLLLMPLPEELVNIPSGKLNRPVIPDSSKSLVDDERLLPFFSNPEVMKRLGNGFDKWVERIPHCQLADGDYCDKNMTIRSYEQGAIRLCWHHDNQEHENLSDKGKQVAKRNLMLWGTELITSMLNLGSDHRLTLPELGWWSVINNVYEYLPQDILDEMMGTKATSRKAMFGGSRDTDARYQKSNVEALHERAKSVLKLKVDAEPPAMFMARPKPTTWKNEKYLKFVRSLPCVVTGSHGTDRDPVVAHHLIGHGEGKMGGKAHDLFTFPILASEHQKLHEGVREWEHKHGSQLLHIKSIIKNGLDSTAII